MDVAPLLMKVIRTEVRKHRPSEISVAQFRVLAFLRNHGGASLSDVTEHIGLCLPSMSSAVDRMVKRGLVVRRECPEDRRRVMLDISDSGRVLFDSARSFVQPVIARQISRLTPEQLQILEQAADIMQQTFSCCEPCVQETEQP